MDISTFDRNNCLTDDEVIDTAYEIFLELAVDNLDPADVMLFNLQFEDHGAAELHDPDQSWLNEPIDFDPIDSEFFAEVVIGLTEKDNKNGEVTDVFAKILICREKNNKYCHILWKE